MNRRSYCANINRIKDSLLQWICEKHATNSPLDRDLLRQRAIDLADHFGVKNFKCSNIWLTVFLKKYGFSATLTNCCGPTFTDYRKWVDLLRSLITQYRYKDLFHVDEMIMYVNVSPGMLPARGDAVMDLNKKDKMAVLMCCNSSGTEKMALLISGGWKSSIIKEDYRYRYDEGSTISMESFSDWLSQLNDRMILTKRKILLLMQRSRIHILKDLQLSNVNLIFFPRDFPTNLRPLRRDIFHYVKMIYRRNYVRHLENNDLMNLSVDDVLENIAHAWKSVPKDLIVSSFQRTSFRSDDCRLNIDYEEWNKLNLSISFKKFVTFDDSLSDDSVELFTTPRSGCSHVPITSYEETIDLDYSEDKSVVEDNADSNLDKDCNDLNTLSISTSEDSLSDMENCSDMKEKEREEEKDTNSTNKNPTIISIQSSNKTQNAFEDPSRMNLPNLSNFLENTHFHKLNNSCEIVPGLSGNPVDLQVTPEDVKINDIRGEEIDFISNNSKDIPHGAECPKISEDRSSSKRKQIGPCQEDEATDVEGPIDKRAKTDDSCSRFCERTFAFPPIKLDTVPNPSLGIMDEVNVIECTVKQSTSPGPTKTSPNMDPEGRRYILTISDSSRSQSDSSKD
ncbi:tigger transposable element-derived protein 6 [Cephus cinctus]|uniref:Tigger transposable element-derived protein 6 n=1 Tax=Cephus cinctus TaxID=211228 RepID=A0AAJ7RCP1_CEPCN|nr:tigger transposable element-derived protein 6 [Cephus cinctus]XP_024938484.1 tigger transposable element-derived protein 6 [Cephus cinctus]XP_024938486.1 tigger transposable element-derived protein 6 [Cephus cinctus]XP_024938489.1 tigger transposable element-derived protein 6 [Cephus cinctus]XP_024938492.1 tigger transposable element-derived protein 6 [Cephus cinctus]XP_024938497.1 tigger transposable element-derived protein 6 [Cephus cinctus]XP_024938503.1 tigger transposable element-deri